MLNYFLLLSMQNAGSLDSSSLKAFQNESQVFYGRERIGESNYHDSQGEFWPKLKQCLTDWTKEALPQSFRTRAF